MPVARPTRPRERRWGNWRVAVGAAILGLLVLVAILAPWLATADPRALVVADRLQPPSRAHPFGTDQLGRDLYTRVLFGARVSLVVGGMAALLGSLAGLAVGLVAASSRVADAVVMRIMDGLMSIPPILLAIALVAVAGGTVTNIVVAVILVESPRVARLVRGLALSLRGQPYVEAAVAAGSSLPRIMVRHLLPAMLSPLLVQATYVWAAAVLLEAALSFIGAGLPPSMASWGSIMSEAKALWQVEPRLIFIPAAFLAVTVLGINLLGEGLRRMLDVAGRR